MDQVCLCNEFMRNEKGLNRLITHGISYCVITI